MPISDREQEPFRHKYLTWGLTSKDGVGIYIYTIYIYKIRNIDLKVSFPIPFIFVRRKAEYEEFEDLEKIYMLH